MAELSQERKWLLKIQDYSCPEQEKLNGYAFLQLLDTMHVIVRGLSDFSSQLCEAGAESTAPLQPCSGTGWSALSLLLGGGSVHINDIMHAVGCCQPLNMTGSKSRNKACIGVPGKSGGARKWEGLFRVETIPCMKNRGCLSHARWSLPTPDSYHPKGNSTANIKIVLAWLLGQFSPLLWNVSLQLVSGV